MDQPEQNLAQQQQEQEEEEENLGQEEEDQSSQQEEQEEGESEAEAETDQDEQVEQEEEAPPSDEQPPSTQTQIDDRAAPVPPPPFDPSRMIGIIRRKSLIKELAAMYHAECLSHCQELLELQRKGDEPRVDLNYPEELKKDPIRPPKRLKKTARH